jgi:glucosamine--fructose-6-phosphate aminotransferase (isomerizing)
MCGIVAIIGADQALPHLLEGLRKLEYRGYDSAGVVLLPEGDGPLWCRKDIGRVRNLEGQVDDAPVSTVGIAHTRWATHGGVTKENAHPHLDSTGRIAVIHNGIVENQHALRSSLKANGITFSSETDSEVIPHLIRAHYKGDPLAAVRAALQQVQGTYGLAVLFADHPDLVIAARNGSPLVIGVGDGQTILASDPQAIVAHTRRVVYLDDKEIAILRADSVRVERMAGGDVATSIEEIEGDYAVADTGDYAHFMLKEIHEQPHSIRRCLMGRVQADAGNAKLSGLNMSPRDLLAIKRVVTIGCGTSFHAGLIGSLAIESLARVPARSEIASEFRYRNPIISADALFLAISQSGETADTLGAVQEISVKGGQVMGVINVVGSTIARTCGAGVYVHSGPEIAVASTKAFTSQVTALLVLTLMLARTRNLSLERSQQIARSLESVPDHVQAYLDNPGPIEEAVDLIKSARYVLFLGRGFSYPVALEGALKLKELAYIPCEAYPAGEMKHGPIAMLEKGTPVVVVAPRDAQRVKLISNMKEVEARGAKLIVIHTEGDDEMAEMATVAIPVPSTADYISPLITVLPLQLIAYHAALALACDVDKPRNLAKSVTVE